MTTFPLPFGLPLADMPAASPCTAIGPVIIVVAIALALILVMRPVLRNVRKSSGDATPAPTGGKATGPVVASRTMAIEGMHCMKCVARVKTALDAIPGVAAEVSLSPQRADVRMDREVPDADLRSAVEALGFRVLSVE